VAGGKEIFSTTQKGDRTYGIAFAPDGRTFATAGDTGSVHLWDVAAGVELLSFESKDRASDTHAVAFSPDGKLLASANGHSIRLWDLDAGGDPLVIEKSRGLLAFTPNGQELICSGHRTVVRTRENGQRVGHSFSVIEAWDPRTGAKLRDFATDESHSGHGMMAMSRDGKLLITSHHDRICLWDVASGKPLHTITDYNNTFGGRTHGMAISPDNQMLAAISGDKAVRLWKLPTGESLLRFPQSHTNSVAAGGYSPDGKLLVTGSRDGALRLWNSAGEQVRLLQAGHSFDRAARFLPDGKTLVASVLRRDEKSFQFVSGLEFWDADTGERLREISTEHRVSTTAVSSDGKLVAAATWNIGDYPGRGAEVPNAIYVWDAAGKQVAEFKGPLKGHQQVVRLAFDPDGKSLWSAGSDAIVRRWSISDGQEVKQWQIRGHQREQLRSAAFTPNGNTVVTGGMFCNTLIVWDLKTGQEQFRIQVPDTLGSVLEVSRDGRVLASAAVQITSTDQKFQEAIHLWDLATGRELLKIGPGDAPTISLAFSPDGTQLMAGTNRGTALIWDVARAYETLGQ
jgi:WD40 repeat protein